MGVSKTVIEKYPLVIEIKTTHWICSGTGPQIDLIILRVSRVPETVEEGGRVKAFGKSGGVCNCV